MGIGSSSLEVDVAGGFVIAIDIGYVVGSHTDGALELSVHVVDVELHEAVPVAGQDDGILGDDSLLISLLLHIFGHALLDEQCGQGAARIHRVEVEIVLMPVQRVHHHAVRVGCGQDARHIAIGIEGHPELQNLVRLDVVAPGRDDGVVLSGLRIFVGIQSGVIGILLMLGVASAEELQGIGLHPRLVVAQPAEHGAVGGEGEGAIESELLFVHPVGDAIDDVVELAVGGHLALGIVVEQLHKEDVVIAHEGHLPAVGRPHRDLLRAAVGEALEHVAGDVVNIIDCFEGAAIDILRLSLDEHAGTVGREDIAVETVNLVSHGVIDVEEHGHLLAGLERVLCHLLLVGTDTCVEVGALDGCEPGDGAGCKIARCNRFQIHFLSSIH